MKIQETFGLFHPIPLTEADFEHLPRNIKDVTFDGENGRLSGLWRQPTDQSQKVIVLFHGNAGNIMGRVEWLESAVPDDFHGFVFDYRGFGYSEGTPTEQGLYEDARQFVKFVENKFSDPNIIYHGRSLGVPVAAHTMKHLCPDGVVFESGFPSAHSVAKTILSIPGLQYMLSVRLNTNRYLEQLSDSCRGIRKLVIHGESDQVIPVQLGQRLFQTLPEPKSSVYLKQVGHNDILRNRRKRYTTELKSFYQRTISKD